MTGNGSRNTVRIDPAADRAARAAVRQVLAAVAAPGWQVMLVDSPPGAGKSTLVRRIARQRADHGDQVPVVTQTNEQADDLVRGLAADLARTRHTVGRLHRSRGYVPPVGLATNPRVRFATDVGALTGCAAIVAPAAKWAHVSGQSWPYAVVDEVYQMGGEELMGVAERFGALAVVGDPGQLNPFTTGDETLVRGVPAGPLDRAADVLLASHPNTHVRTLPVSWRLTPAAAGVVSDSFYATPFTAGVRPGARKLTLRRLGNADALDAALGQAATSGWALLELPEAHLPVSDRRAVDTLAQLVVRALNARGSCRDENGSTATLTANRLAVGVTHRAQRDAVRAALAGLGLGPDEVVVDTANRLQGREFELVLAWHPLSGRVDASAFHLEAGRLCVLASRHRQACVLVTRGGVERTLETYPQPAPLWLGERQAAVEGWEAHLRFLEHLRPHRIVA